MKKIISLCLMLNMVTGYALANGPSGTAEVDAKYLKKQKTDTDTVHTRSSAFEKKTIHEMEKNPRNPAMVESFGQVGSKEDDQERMEEKKDRD